MEPIKKISELTIKDIASICDHTYLNRPEAFRSIAEKGQNPISLWKADFEKFLKETVEFEHKPYAVCVRPECVGFTKNHLINNNSSEIIIASVVGFPQNMYNIYFMIAETNLAVKHGATEIDFVLDYQSLKGGQALDAHTSIEVMAALTQKLGVKSKIILEISELEPEHIKEICQKAEKEGIDFVKTSSGYTGSGANAKDLRLMKENFSRGIKMSGGVNPNNVSEFLEAISGRDDGCIDLDPMKIRIGESSLLRKLKGQKSSENSSY
ncbi:hypothetical protein GOV14_02140 [Candidatus Pacearchaeota archaeon]|nr:hypothetical protein [Candidatus Pacearchaeota archaeon]